MLPMVLKGVDFSRAFADLSWIDGEIAGCCFKDLRLARRFGTLLEWMGSAMGQTIPLACQDWANTKAAYRFGLRDLDACEPCGHAQGSPAWIDRG